jgi:hypothetical protein
MLRKVKYLSSLLFFLAACQTQTVPTGPPPSGAPSLTLSPHAINVNAGEAPTTFSATVQNSSEPVSWTLVGPGNIAPTSGSSTRYTPPVAINGTQSATLTATLGTTGVTASARITVYPASVTPPPDPPPTQSPPDDPPPSQPPPDDRTVVIPGTTKVADDSTRDALTSFDVEDGVLHFSETTSLLSALEPGDVLVSEPSQAAPHGYLRKVEGISREGNEVLLETTQASLTEAVHQGSFDAQGELAASDLMATKTYVPGVSARALPPTPRTLQSAAGEVVSEGYNFEVAIDVVLNFDEEGEEASGSGEVRVNGLLRFNAGYSIGFGVELCGEIPPVCVDRFEARMGIDQYADLKVNSKIEGRVKKEHTLATFYFKPIVVFIGPVPVVIVPKIDAVVGARGEAKAVFGFEARESAQWLLGAKWTDPDDDGRGWEDLSTHNGFQHHVTSPDFEATMLLRAYGKSDMKLLLYGLSGPAVDAWLGLGLDAQVPRRPLWRLFGHLGGRFSFQLDIASIVKTDVFEKTLFEFEPQLMDAPNYPPRFSNVKSDVIQVDLGKPTVLGPRAGFSGYFDVSDPEGDPFTLTAVSDKDGTIPLNVTFLSGGPRTVTVSARDNAGASSSTTLRLNVINSPPILTTTVASDTVPATVNFVVGARAFDPNTGDLSCDRFSWSVSAPDTVTPLAGGGGCEAVAVFAVEGTRTLTVTATDPHGGSASETLTVRVSSPPQNAAPVIDSFSIKDANGLEVPAGGVLYNGQAGDYYPPLKLAVSAHDPNGDPLTIAWSCETGSYQAPITDNGDGTYSCSPGYSSREPINVKVEVSDGVTSTPRVRSFVMLDFIR